MDDYLIFNHNIIYYYLIIIFSTLFPYLQYINYSFKYSGKYLNIKTLYFYLFNSNY